MNRYFLIGAVGLALAASACNKQEKENTAPQCAITAPADGASFEKGTDITITGTIKDAEDNVRLTLISVNGKTVTEKLAVPEFSYSLSTMNLNEGVCIIELYAEDEKGLKGSATVKVNLTETVSGPLLTCNGRTDDVNVSVDGIETTVKINSNGAWTLSGDGDILHYVDATKIWEPISTYRGSGKTELRVMMKPSDRFEEYKSTLRLMSNGKEGSLGFIQEASPDYYTFFEDENFRQAAMVSLGLYGVDANADYKLSRYELSVKFGPTEPYGINAGDYNVKSTKGIEYIPQLKHLDVNRNPNLTEIDLSGNPMLASLHVNGCTNLKSLDISKNPALIEFGADLSLFARIKSEIDKLKGQMHTIAALNPVEGDMKSLDFTGYSALSRLYVNNDGLTELKLAGCTSLWKLVAYGNLFNELDLSDVDRLRENDYHLENNPNLKKIYVWKGFTIGWYNVFNYDKDNGIEFIEK